MVVMPLLVLTCLALFLVLWLLGEPYWISRRRAALRAKPFPAAWRSILQRRVPLFRRLPADLQLQLKQHIQVFIAEKAFIGCAGQEITDDVRVTVAAQACLLLLNRPNHYFPGLRQILVYPGSFVVQRGHTDGLGIAHLGREVLAGESWEQGQVVLSWQDSLEGALIADDGNNVVIHEFAHQLDQATGSANGAPRLTGRHAYRHWSAVLGAEYAALQERVGRQEPSLINDYAATNPAEFFAVVSELFFEIPWRMASEHPELYNELARFYRVSPLHWH
jgi:Mlc titration factor MtfA (ptsG expression regulator)